MAEPPIPDAVKVARELASGLGELGQDYALGGAIALAFGAVPRGTGDVDLTFFLPRESSSDCAQILQRLGCQVQGSAAVESLLERGFCSLVNRGRRVDVFAPTVPFYEVAKRRRRRVQLDDRQLMIWDAETLCVFKIRSLPCPGPPTAVDSSKPPA